MGPATLRANDKSVMLTSLDEIPFNTEFATDKQGVNSIKLLCTTAKGIFQTNLRNCNPHTFGENFLQKSLPPESHLNRFLCDISELLKYSDICIHIKSTHCEEHMGFCYELFRPPRISPLFWYMNSTPTHYKDSSRIRSLQLSLVG